MAETNHTIQFMPWCHLDKQYQVGEILIVPVNGYDPFENYDTLTAYRIRTVLSSYKRIDGSPVRNYSLVKFAEREITAFIEKDEHDIPRELVDLAAFSGLANRDYFNDLGNQCNYDCFTLYIQNFAKEPTHVALTPRGMCGPYLSSHSSENLVITMGDHIVTRKAIILNQDLISSLIKFRSSANPDKWIRWLNSIRCYNQANTDNDHTRYQVEWILLCSAIQDILEAKSNKKEVAKEFTKLFQPESEISGLNSKRNNFRQEDEKRPLRFHWMKEFYNIRGDYAHGKLKSDKEFTWNELEHLVLAKIAFPLIVKILLNGSSHYSLTDRDREEINIFESLADVSFCTPPNDDDSTNFLNTWYHRLRDQERSRINREKGIKRLESRINNSGEGINDNNDHE